MSDQDVTLPATQWPPEENCYCGGPEEIYPHRAGTGRYCRNRTPAAEPRRIAVDLPACDYVRPDGSLGWSVHGSTMRASVSTVPHRPNDLALELESGRLKEFACLPRGEACAVARAILAADAEQSGQVSS